MGRGPDDYEGRPNREDLQFRDLALWKIGWALYTAIQETETRWRLPSNEATAILIDGIHHWFALVEFEDVDSWSIVETIMRLVGVYEDLCAMHPSLRVAPPSRRCCYYDCSDCWPNTKKEKMLSLVD